MVEYMYFNSKLTSGSTGKHQKHFHQSQEKIQTAPSTTITPKVQMTQQDERKTRNKK